MQVAQLVILSMVPNDVVFPQKQTQIWSKVEHLRVNGLIVALSYQV